MINLPKERKVRFKWKKKYFLKLDRRVTKRKTGKNEDKL